MARFLKSREKAKGASPGSLIFLGNQKMESTRIRLFSYTDTEISENEFTSIHEALGAVKENQLNWLNIDGLHDTDILKEVGHHFNISPLALENILNTGQRSKYFEDKNSITVLTKAVYYNVDKDDISVEQISFILLENVVISFQEKTGDHFEPVRNRLRSGVGRIRNSTADYLMYALIDCLVDNYLINLELLGNQIESMDDKIPDTQKESSKLLFHYKTEITYFRKTIKPLKEVMIRLLRAKVQVINPENIVYFQELSDLVEQSIEAVESYFVMTNDLINLYNTYLSNKVNDVMKVLTIFASIFIPLTFIAGIYGTNFDNVPELHYKYAYFIMWGVMITVAGTMLYYFKKHKWF